MTSRMPGDSPVSGDEMEALLNLCMLGVSRTGSEDPKSMVRKLSDPLLEHALKHVAKNRADRVFVPISQILLIEWCWRNDYLREDWHWRWEDAGGGQMKYNPRIPLDMVPVPT